MPTLGMNCTLTIGADPAIYAKNVTIDADTALADATTRNNAGFKVEIPTLRALKISFELQYEAGDTVFTALLAAYNANTSLEVTAGDFNAMFYVSKLSRKEPLEEVVTYDVEMTYAGAAGS